MITGFVFLFRFDMLCFPVYPCMPFTSYNLFLQMEVNIDSNAFSIRFTILSN